MLDCLLFVSAHVQSKTLCILERCMSTASLKHDVWRGPLFQLCIISGHNVQLVLVKYAYSTGTILYYSVNFLRLHKTSTNRRKTLNYVVTYPSLDLAQEKQDHTVLIGINSLLVTKSTVKD